MFFGPKQNYTLLKVGQSQILNICLSFIPTIWNKSIQKHIFSNTQQPKELTCYPRLCNVSVHQHLTYML